MIVHRHFSVSRSMDCLQLYLPDTVRVEADPTGIIDLGPEHVACATHYKAHHMPLWKRSELTGQELSAVDLPLEPAQVKTDDRLHIVLKIRGVKPVLLVFLLFG